MKKIAFQNNKRFVPRGTPAIQSDLSSSGSFGGMLAGIRRDTRHECLPTDKWQGPFCVSTVDDMIGTAISLQGIRVLVFGSYHRGGASHEQIAQVFTYTSQGRVPFFWLADWNEPPDSISITSWISTLRAEVVVPSGGPTCINPGKDSIIDYMVCSSAVLGLI